MNTDQPIDMKSWKTVKCIQGRLATKEDISHGSAAFVIDPKNNIVRPIVMSLPCCAILKEDNNEIPVIIIQAEEIVNGPKIFGAIDVYSGAHKVFSDKDKFEILQEPNDLFTQRVND